MLEYQCFKSIKAYKYLWITIGLLSISGMQVFIDTSKLHNQGYIIEKTICYLKGCRKQSNITELQAWELPVVTPDLCVRTSRLGKTEVESFMCLKSFKEDEVISGEIVKNGMYEPLDVGVTSDIAHIYPEATFIDIGANIGTHSLAALSNGCKVVSVEPMPRNLAYISKSAYLMNKHHNIKYLQNAVSNVSEILYGWLDANNKNGYKSNGGTTSFHSKTSLEKLSISGKNKLGMSMTVKSVTLEDILNYINPKVAFIKVDAEGKDCMVLHDYIWKPNKKVYIPYITMEWMNVYHKNNNLCLNIDHLIEGFYEAGYSPYNMLRVLINRDKLLNPLPNVLWIHKDAKKIQLSKEAVKYVIEYGNGYLSEVFS